MLVKGAFMLHVASEAEERATKEAEERAQQDEAMEPQDVNEESEHPDPSDGNLEGEVPEAAAVSRPADGLTGGSDQGAHNPSLQNGMSLRPVFSGRDCNNITFVKYFRHWTIDLRFKKKENLLFESKFYYFIERSLIFKLI